MKTRLWKSFCVKGTTRVEYFLNTVLFRISSSFFFTSEGQTTRSWLYIVRLVRVNLEEKMSELRSKQVRGLFGVVEPGAQHNSIKTESFYHI